jgi:hypothetical protein
VADLGFIKTLLRGIEDTKTRSVLDQAFTHVLQNLRYGVPDHQVRAENAQMYWLQSTTASDTGEFSIAHGLQTVPHYALPVLELDRPGAKVVPLEVTRAADARRIYVKSTSTSAPITLLVEG